MDLSVDMGDAENLDARALLMCMEDYTTPQELLGMFGQWFVHQLLCVVRDSCSRSVADIRGNTKLLSLLGGMTGLQQRCVLALF